jgi:hypothetical protein
MTPNKALSLPAREHSPLFFKKAMFGDPCAKFDEKYARMKRAMGNYFPIA